MVDTKWLAPGVGACACHHLRGSPLVELLETLPLGGSCIVNLSGQLLAGPNFTEEYILMADLDLDNIIRGKYGFDVVGYYARPNIFRLEVNERRQLSVTKRGDEDLWALNPGEPSLQKQRNILATTSKQTNEEITR